METKAGEDVVMVTVTAGEVVMKDPPLPPKKRRRQFWPTLMMYDVIAQQAPLKHTSLVLASYCFYL